MPTELGMGLVRGYEDMELQLHTPDLRAGLEADLKDICEEKKRPENVLRQQVCLFVCFRQGEPENLVLRHTIPINSPLSVEFWMHCLLNGGTQRRLYR